MQEDDDVSSMHSKEMHFGGANKRSRAFSGISSDLKDSDTSSEMIEALNDKEADFDGQMTRISGNSLVKLHRDSETQTNPISKDLKNVTDSET